MPAYTYVCRACSYTYWQMRRIADRDRVGQCPKCDDGLVKRQLDATQGILRSTQPARRESLPAKRPTVIMRDCFSDSDGAGGMKLVGSHADIDGYTVTNTHTALELTEGATVDARNVRHDVGSTRQAPAPR